MKKLLLLAVVLMAAVAVNAKDEFTGSFAPLAGEAKIKVVEDWNNTKIVGRQLADWLEYRQAEQPEYNAENEWENELKPQLKECLLGKANEKLEDMGLFLSETGETKFVMTVHPVSVEKKGNQVVEFTVREASTQKEVVKFTINGKGGTFGSMSNLWGDGFKDTGKKLANLLKNELNKLKQ
ncbi:hypothetical protein [Prevotella sp. kh1p2]|uniref:hypothetical protein n=1 Tax=Prevotella sp. kh1p2 TaxID=1761883 RepID=UPI0008D3ADD3|nr:hypothetical protein [Prevotella sp. kh1p2]SET24842.1 hypothetical protein SAMN04487825_12410 [Prevotella sp. kh1p2]SNU12384.1 hypothetical protein SAMN06298210_12411 [Prevotellaceae bacterium KH2P17]